ncbi:MAG: hypothetical protein PHE24_03505 [Patescibacteria group bacterium]|nr:hypothetical protein [Patescibacteria group bacterium]
MSPSEKLEIIEKEIDGYISKQPIFGSSRNLMVLNLLRYLEFVSLSNKETSTLENYLANGHSTECQNLRGVSNSIDWAHEYCKSINNFDYKFDESTLRELKLAFSLSQNYGNICDIFYYIRKNILDWNFKTDKEILLTQKDQETQLFKVINYFIGTHEVEKFNSVPSVILKMKGFLENVIAFSNKVKIKGNTNFFNFDFNIPEIYPVYNELLKEQTRLQWRLDEKWELGGYSVSDFRLAFVAILTIATLHSFLLFGIFSKREKLNVKPNKFFQNLVMFNSKQKWVKMIKNLSNLPSDKIEHIIDDLTYDFSNRRNKNKIGVTAYCFYRIGDPVLALSNEIVRSSNAERNAWLMLERKNRQLHSKWGNEKENYWRENIISELRKRKIWVFERGINILGTNIDLLVIDFNKKFGLSIELKWLTPPNRIRDYSSLIDPELRKGREQASICEKWLNSSKNELAKKTGIEYSKINNINFGSIVLSKNSIGSQAVNTDDGPPIVSEDLFWWIIKEPFNEDITTLYKIAKEKKFYPRINKHFTVQDCEVEYAGYKFIEKDCYVPHNNTWNPRRDIKK